MSGDEQNLTIKYVPGVLASYMSDTNPASR